MPGVELLDKLKENATRLIAANPDEWDRFPGFIGFSAEAKNRAARRFRSDFLRSETRDASPTRFAFFSQRIAIPKGAHKPTSVTKSNGIQGASSTGSVGIFAWSNNLSTSGLEYPV